MLTLSKPRTHKIHGIPLSERRGFGTMALLWITMVTAFPSVLSGFQWHAEGLTFLQSLGCAVISCLILLAYSVPACMLGALSTHAGTEYAKRIEQLITAQPRDCKNVSPSACH